MAPDVAHALTSELRVVGTSTTEGNSGITFAIFTVERDVALPTVCSFKATAGFGVTSTANADDLAQEGTALSFTMPANSTSIQINAAQVVGDTVLEPNETYTVTLTSVSVNGHPACAVSPLTRRSVGRIINDDIGVSIADTSLIEGNSGTSTMKFRLTLSRPAVGTESVAITTSNGTAVAPGDYAPRNAVVVTFNPGQTLRDVGVTIKGDTTLEPDETFTVTLTNPVGVTITDALAVGTIANDESAGLTIAPVTVTEPVGPSFQTVDVTLTRPVPAAAQCNLTATVLLAPDDTASAADLNVSIGNAQNFLVDASATSKVVSPVAIAPDTLVEGTETFTLQIAGAPFANIPGCEVNPAAASAKVTILDEDQGTTVSIDDASLVEGATGATTTMSFRLTLSAPAVGTETVTITTADGTAVAPGDYAARNAVVVTFNPGQTARTVGVNIKGDATVEPNETFTVTLGSPVGLIIADGTAVGTITNDD